MIARALRALLLLFLSGTAMAQKMCDQVRTNITAALAAISEKVAGVPNQRIYLCGYMILHNGSATGPDLRLKSHPAAPTARSARHSSYQRCPYRRLVRYQPHVYTAEKTAPGAAVCLEVFGSGTSLVSSFY
jgi:hypothetical protein